MLRIIVTPGENIDKALKRYKQKVQKTNLVNQLRDRQQFVKKSVKKREQLLKAIYVNKKFGNESE